MTRAVSIRTETASDAAAIAAVTAVAFRNHPFSDQSETRILEALRADGALALSLVAEVDRQVVGHVAFSLVSISDRTSDWYGLGPVSVLPAFQGQGIGRALIEQGLEKLQQLGAKGCVLLGEPELYQRFGFLNRSGLILAGVPQAYFLARSFDAQIPAGVVQYHPAFSVAH